jgi:hypothetical protein
MPPIDPEFIALGRTQAPMQKSRADLRSALSSASCRRSGRSPALPYPPHERTYFIILSSRYWPDRTSLLCRK